MKGLLRVLAFIICFASFNHLSAQVNPTDNRSVQTLSKGNLQVDGHYGYNKRGPLDTKSLHGLLRYGFKNNFELQLGYTNRNGDLGYFNRWNAPLSVESDEALRAGLKMYLFSEKDYFLGVSAIASINLTTDTDMTPFMPGLNILIEKQVGSFLIQLNEEFLFNESIDKLSNQFNASIQANLLKWLDVRVGLTGVKSYPQGDLGDALYQEYVEVGTKIWVADGISIYPFYDFGIGEDSDDVLGIGVLLRLK